MQHKTPIFDVILAGAGIVGLATAWQLLRKNPHLRIAILEKEPRPALHQSSRNSGVIHSGVYYEPGSSKALNCIKGYHLLLEFAREYAIPHQLCGKLISATEPSEIPGLHSILKRGTENGLKGLELLDAKSSREAEPHVAAIESIWVPQAGIIDYAVVCEKLVDRIQQMGGSIYFDHAMTGLEEGITHNLIRTKYGDFQCRVFVNCCGLYADRVALLTGMQSDYRIFPFRGEFYAVTGKTAEMVRHLVYPVPDPRFPFLGVHFTLRLDGGVEAGPNAVLAFGREGYGLSHIQLSDLSEILTSTGFYRMAFRYWSKGWEEMHRSFSKTAFHKSMQKLIPEARLEDMRYARSGVRAQCVSSGGKMLYDYLVLENDRVINLVNSPSPAATSSLSIGAEIAGKIIGKMQ